MQNEDEIKGQVGEMAFADEDVPPSNPVIIPKAGWATSQGQMTAIVQIFCMVMLWFGYNIEPSQVDSVIANADRWAAMILPFLTMIGTLVPYINSRGKIQSNAINANSAIQVANLAGLGGVGAVLGGKNWKDPARYGKIAEIAGAFIPGVGGAISRGAAGTLTEVSAMQVSQSERDAYMLDKLMDKANRTPAEQALYDRLLSKAGQ